MYFHCSLQILLKRTGKISIVYGLRATSLVFHSLGYLFIKVITIVEMKFFYFTPLQEKCRLYLLILRERIVVDVSVV